MAIRKRCVLNILLYRLNGISDILKQEIRSDEIQHASTVDQRHCMRVSVYEQNLDVLFMIRFNDLIQNLYSTLHACAALITAKSQALIFYIPCINKLHTTNVQNNKGQMVSSRLF